MQRIQNWLGAGQASHMEPLEGRVLLAGVTFVTHGRQATDNFPAWTGAMADAVALRAGEIGRASTTMRMAVDGGGRFAGLQRLSSTDSNSTTRAETVISLDWAPASGAFTNIYSSWHVAGQSLSPFLSATPAAGAASPFAEVPIHLIGHSRGAAVVDDIAEQLGQHGIWVDQVTYLDAYPWNDTAISAKDNVLFADSYNQRVDWPIRGVSVSSAANTNLDSRIGIAHENVHTFYHGTIQPSATAVSGGNAIQSSWYTSSRSEIGFRFSRLGGGDRTAPAVSAGLLASLGGSAGRPEAPRDAAVAQWPNVANLRLGANRVLNQNSTTTLSFAFADRDSTSNLRVFFDNDDNPYNGTVKEVTSRTLASTSFDTGSVTIDGVGLAPGTYYVGAEVNDGGGRRRFAYAQDQVTMQQVSPPVTPPVTNPETMPHRLYFPEGNTANASANINEYLPMVNPNDFAVTYEVIARYEVGARDQVIASGTLPALSRGGPTIYEGRSPQQSLVRFDSPYALEIRSSGPIGATMSHYDFGVGTGEAFTSQTSQTWVFPSVWKDTASVRDFILWYNPTDTAATVTITAFTQSGQSFSSQMTVEGLRRGGIAFEDAGWAPLGEFSVSITASTPIVAALSHYETRTGQGFISLGDPHAASTSGSIPLVDPSNTSTERIVVMNPGTESATVTFATGIEGQVRVPTRQLTIPPGGSQVVLGSDLNIPRDQRVLVRYISNQPISMVSSVSDNSREDALGTTAISQRARKWAFSDGYMPNGDAGTKLIEHLTLVNDNDTLARVNVDVIPIWGGKTTIWADVPARSSRTFNLHTENAVLDWGRRNVGSPAQPRPELNFFGLYVDSDLPIGASMVHWDMNQMGGWQSLGTPIGPLTRT
jgi:hypothetical protein